MSNHTNAGRPLGWLADLEGLRIPGGCPDCAADQTLECVAEGVTVLTVHHDATCPTWAAMGGDR